MTGYQICANGPASLLTCILRHLLTPPTSDTRKESWQGKRIELYADAELEFKFQIKIKLLTLKI
jgi:hypothetical protein